MRLFIANCDKCTYYWDNLNWTSVAHDMLLQKSFSIGKDIKFFVWVAKGLNNCIRMTKERYWNYVVVSLLLNKQSMSVKDNRTCYYFIMIMMHWFHSQHKIKLIMFQIWEKFTGCSLILTSSLVRIYGRKKVR